VDVSGGSTADAFDPIVTISRSGRDRSLIRDLSVTFLGRYPFVIGSILDGDYPLVVLVAGHGRADRPVLVHRSAVVAGPDRQRKART
jgi:hypothetical protein